MLFCGTLKENVPNYSHVFTIKVKGVVTNEETCPWPLIRCKLMDLQPELQKLAFTPFSFRVRLLETATKTKA